MFVTIREPSCPPSTAKATARPKQDTYSFSQLSAAGLPRIPREELCTIHRYVRETRCPLESCPEYPQISTGMLFCPQFMLLQAFLPNKLSFTSFDETAGTRWDMLWFCCVLQCFVMICYVLLCFATFCYVLQMCRRASWS